MKKISALFLILFFVQFTALNSLASQELEKQALSVTSLFRALRATIAKNKDAIHDVDNYFKDYKARTKSLLSQAESLYAKFSGHKLSDDLKSPIGGSLKNMIRAYKEVIKEVAAKKHSLRWEGENSYIRKWDGKLLPARFGNLLAQKYNMTDSKVQIKLTTSKRLLVNPKNAPDAWESEVIEQSLIMANSKTGKPVKKDFGYRYRYILPEFYLPACIGCHGTGKGQEGTKIHPTRLKRDVGSFAGGISVTIIK